MFAKYLNKHLELKSHWKIAQILGSLTMTRYLCMLLDLICTLFKGFRYVNMVLYLITGKFPSLTYSLANINAISSLNNFSSNNYLSRSIVIRHLLDSLLVILNALNIRGVSELISFVGQSSLNYGISVISVQQYLRIVQIGKPPAMHWVWLRAQILLLLL